MIRRPPRSTPLYSSAASDVYKRQPSDFIKHFDDEWGDGLTGDKLHCMVFNNSKIRKLVPEFKATIPFSKGAREIAEWYMGDKSHQIIDDKINWKIDEVIGWFEKGLR